MTAVHFAEPLLPLHITGSPERPPEDARDRMVVQRSAPRPCGVRKKPHSPCSPPVVPPIAEVEEEDISSLTYFRYLTVPSPAPDLVLLSSSKEENLSFIQKLRRSSLTFRESLRRRLSSPSLEEMGRSMERVQIHSSPPRTLARRQSTIGVVMESERTTGRGAVDWERSSFGDSSLHRCSSGDRLTHQSSSSGQARRASLGGQANGRTGH